MKVTYYVLNDHTLGYVQEGDKSITVCGYIMFNILHGDKDGLDWRYGYSLVAPSDKLVRATKEDFEKFRVTLPPDFE